MNGPSRKWTAQVLCFLMMINVHSAATSADEFTVPVTKSKEFDGDCKKDRYGQVLKFKTDDDFTAGKGTSVVEELENGVKLTCVDGSVGVLWIAKPENRRPYSKMSWHWKVASFASAVGNKKLDDDDQSAQLMVIYQAKNGVYPTRSFVWIHEKPATLPLCLKSYPGEAYCDNYLDVNVVIQRVGKPSGWESEAVKLPKDSGDVVGILLFADSNDTHSTSIASFKNIVLTD